MKIPFWRYSATGNTFLFFTNRGSELHLKPKSFLQELAKSNNVDGLIFLEESSDPEAHFHMRYLNADGGEVEMCGNGARSIVHFAHEILNIPTNDKGEYFFTTQCALYKGRPDENYPVQMIELKEVGAIDVSDLIEGASFSYYMNTGVPHALFEISDIENLAIKDLGAKVRYDERFEKGANANFFKIASDKKVLLRTYERGVEDETLSCGTGATAVALSLAKLKGFTSPVALEVRGGELQVSFNDDFSEVFLAGPVEMLGAGSADFPE